MNLDDLNYFRQTDPDDMLGHIAGLPQQCRDAWEQAQRFELPTKADAIRQAVVAGMGGSAIGGALVQALAAPECRVPIMVLRDYNLPAYAQGAETLVIGASYSGNTEETLSAFAQAHERGCQLIATTTGGRIAELARDYGAPTLHIPYKSQPRAAVGYAFVSLVAIACRLRLLSDKAGDLDEAVRVMQARQPVIHADNPVVRNPAKRLAGQLVQRIPVVYGAGYLAPVARRWKTQFNENAKAWSHFEVMPELDHNAVSGISFPRELMTKVAVIQLTSALDHPQVQRRHDITREIMMQQGIAVDVIKGRGESALAQMLTALHFGDYTSYYLAMCYGVDPTPVPSIAQLKERLSQ
jgi:glucose/mannose-6-phosphate isomerase